jgi:molybdopterin synthase catalytic subunit
LNFCNLHFAISFMIQLTSHPIDTAALVDHVRHPEAGAVVMFLGTTRELTGGRQTVALDYEAYHEMAERRLRELEAEARRRWPVIECMVVHRLGRVPPTETSVAIAVSTPHRADAFAAGQWLIDSLKRDVPIWKREQWADGSTEWVHPGMNKEGEQGRGGEGEKVRSNESPHLPRSPSPSLPAAPPPA